MGLLEALENFADNLPTALDGLKGLQRDFRKTFGELAREGAELFTIGFEEMVIKDNNAWQTSFENRQQAQQVVEEARRETGEACQHYEAVVKGFTDSFEAFDKAQMECWEALSELAGLVEPFSAASGQVWEVKLDGLPMRIGESAGRMVEEVARRAFDKILRSRGVASTEGTEEGECWRVERVAADHRRSVAELAAAQAQAADAESVRAILAWECGQLPAFSETAGKAACLFSEAGRYFMSRANEVEGWQDASTPETAKRQEALREIVEAAAVMSGRLGTALLEEMGINPLFDERLLRATGQMETFLERCNVC